MREILTVELRAELGDLVCEILTTAEGSEEITQEATDRGITRSQLLAAAIVGAISERLETEVN